MPKKMKPGKLKGPSHKKGGILLEAEGGEYIIKKSSVKKLGKATLDKINKEGKLPMKKNSAKRTYVKGARRSKYGPEGKKSTDVKVRGSRVKGARMSKHGPEGKTSTDVKVKGGNKRKIQRNKMLKEMKKMGGVDSYRTKSRKSPKMTKKMRDQIHRHIKNLPKLKKAGGGKVGDSIKTYASGGYVEGK
jgi:hypothetical protein